MMMMMMIFALLLFQIQCQCLLLCGKCSLHFIPFPLSNFSPLSGYQFRVSVLLLFSFYFSDVSVRLHCTAVCLCVLYSSVRRPSQCQSVSDMRSVTRLPMLSSLKFSLSLSNFLSFFYCLDHSAIVHCRRRSFAGQTLLPAYDDFDYHGKSAHMLFLPFSLFFLAVKCFPFSSLFDQLSSAVWTSAQHMLCVGCLCSLTMMAAMMSMKLNWSVSAGLQQTDFLLLFSSRWKLKKQRRRRWHKSQHALCLLLLLLLFFWLLIHRLPPSLFSISQRQK